MRFGDFITAIKEIADCSLAHVTRFIDASLSIRRVEEASYQLVVTRTYQEGEEQLLEEDAESKCWRGGCTDREPDD